MILNLESKASFSPVLNLQSVAPVVLDLTVSAKSPVLDMQATHWPEPLASESLALIGTQLVVAVLLIGVSGGASWLFRSQLANMVLSVTQTNHGQQTQNPVQSAKPQSPFLVQPRFPAPAAPFNTGLEPSGPTVKFTQPVNVWVKRQEIDLWIKPSPPYGSPPQALEAKGRSLLYNGESFKTKAKKRVPVYHAPDTGDSVAFYLEPGQTTEIYEAYEKTIKPGVVRFQKDWKDPKTGVVYRAGEVVNFYTYQEGGCYWFWYSQHSQGQLGDGYCPPYIEGTTDVQEAESIKFSHIRTLAGDKRDGWIEVKHLPEGEEAFEDLSLEEQQQSQQSQEQSPEPTNLPTPQMQVGDSYVTESINYNNPKLNNITERTVIAVASNGDFTLTSRNQKSGYTRTIEYTGQWNVKGTRGNTGEGSSYSPPVAYFDFPLYPGKQWSRPSVETDSKTGALRAHNVDGKVGDWEQVSVPAGTFRALRITLKTKVFDTAAGKVTEGEDISWYVPEAKRSVKSEMTTVSDTGVSERQTLQLLEYHVR